MAKSKNQSKKDLALLSELATAMERSGIDYSLDFHSDKFPFAGKEGKHTNYGFSNYMRRKLLSEGLK